MFASYRERRVGVVCALDQILQPEMQQLPPALQFKICRIFRDSLFSNWRLTQIVDTLFLTSLVMRMRRVLRSHSLPI